MTDQTLTTQQAESKVSTIQAGLAVAERELKGLRQYKLSEDHSLELESLISTLSEVFWGADEIEGWGEDVDQEVA